jgi:predicted O-methyltransferase YrrM
MLSWLIFVPMSNLTLAFNFLAHRINALLSGGGSDPFFRDFGQHILFDDPQITGYEFIEKIRSDLLKNTEPLASRDFGAGSRSLGMERTIGQITRASSINPRYGRLLNRLVRYYRPSRIIELGTAAGISTLYLASGNREAEVITVEGNPRLAEIASGNFRKAGLKNVTVINSTFEEALPEITKDLTSGFLVFIDGNHTKEATLRYYSVFAAKSGINPILIFDDINWSDEMRSAWKKIVRQTPGGNLIDLFFMGICFPDLSSPLQFHRMNY